MSSVNLMYGIYVYACAERQTFSMAWRIYMKLLRKKGSISLYIFYALLSRRRERAGEAGKESGKVGRKWRVSALIYTHVKLQTSALGEQGVRRVLSSYVAAVVLSQIDRKEFSPEGGVPLSAFHVTNVSFPS